MCSTQGLVVCVLVLVALVVPDADAARILAIIPTPSVSHQLPFRLIALELVRRGHQVTFITTDPIKKNIENYTEIDMSHTYKDWKAAVDYTSMSEAGPVDNIKLYPNIGRRICEAQLGSPQMEEFIRARPTFDLVVLQRLMYQCYYGVVHRLGSPPLVGFVSHTPIAPLYESVGNPNNPAYSPEVLLGYSHHMSFCQRLYNAYFILRFNHHWLHQTMAVQEEILRERFGPEPPSVYETERNFSLLLVSNHFSANYPRPLLPNVVEVTGMHIQKERQPLPQEIQNFLDSAVDGVIYFSLGSNVKSSAMPEPKIRAFVEAFRHIPQRVLWKWELDDLPGKPHNVMIAKWLPQQDVLAHPNVRLFIMQGGLQSLNEAAYFAVPLIGLPFMADQKNNVAKIVHSGIGYGLEFKDLTSDLIRSAISTVLGNKNYRENMERFSAVYREHQETSLERAVWWIEYVVRHQGAPHLRSAALDLHWWQLLLLDVVAFVVLVVAAIVYVLHRLISLLIRVSCGTSKKKVK